MRNAVAITIFIAVMAVAGCLGAAAPLGICVSIWRYECVDSLVGPKGDRGHPASWVFLALQLPSGLLAIAGALTLYLLLLHVFPWLTPEVSRESRRLHSNLLHWERRCAIAWRRQILFELRRLETSGEPAAGEQGSRPV
ncbi:MAG TPA: hypothetical protein VG406_25230 [Isosphaeraceae bacterium]|jgi:hypothetical protein|nr:hypothetical protein [Isosphaeraceae bacterium]